MHLPTLRTIVTMLSALTVAACGGSKKPAEDASTEKAAPTADVKQADATTTGEASDKAATEKKDESPADSGTPKVVRTAKTKLQAPDIVFKFNFKESDVGIKAEKECSESSKGDGAKMAKCMASAQKKVVVDDYHFKQGDSDNWLLLGLRTNGAKVTWTHRLPIEFDKDSETSVVVKIVGPDKGQAPWRKPPSEITFEVPNDYQMTQQDPTLGKLVFDAKISTLGDGEKKPAR